MKGWDRQVSGNNPTHYHVDWLSMNRKTQNMSTVLWRYRTFRDKKYIAVLHWDFCNCSESKQFHSLPSQTIQLSVLMLTLLFNFKSVRMLLVLLLCHDGKTGLLHTHFSAESTFVLLFQVWTAHSINLSGK